MADGRTQRALGHVLEPFAPVGAVWRYDLEGPALYQLAPTWVTVVLCPACGFASVVASIPRRPKLVHVCPACEHPAILRPPLDVLAAAPPATPAAH